MDKIEKNINSIKTSDDWDYKIKKIKTTKKMISAEKNTLYKYKNDLNEDNTSEIDFEDFDLDNVINKINKTENLSKKIKYYKLLKVWYENQKKLVKYD